MEQMVYLGVPTTGWIKSEAFWGIAQASRRSQVVLDIAGVKPVTRCFNYLWRQALNLRAKRRFTHFAMIHEDVQAPLFWIDCLVDELERVGGDIICAAIPIKNGFGLTSTGVNRENARVHRLTVTELQRLPETFGIADLVDVAREPDLRLMINLGLWACRFTEPWIEEVCFVNTDAMHRNPDGTFEESCCTEDWAFSHWAAKRGLKVFATRKVALTHHGDMGYVNHAPWGAWEYDEETGHALVPARISEGVSP